MKRLFGLLFSTVLGLTLWAGPALAQFPEHPHVLVLGLELDEQGEPVDFRKCVDLASNQALPLNAHHEHLHFGTAGEALFEHAGHVVVPVAPFPDPSAPVPWTNCETLIAFFFGD